MSLTAQRYRLKNRACGQSPMPATPLVRQAANNGSSFPSLATGVSHVQPPRDRVRREGLGVSD